MSVLDDSSRWEIDCEELVSALAEREQQPFRLIDCREKDEHALCRIRGDELMPLSDFATQANRFTAAEERMVIYCHHGMRSMQATQFLRARGHAHVFSLSGGIDAWAELIEPEMARY